MAKFGPIVNPANAITFSRFFTLPPFVMYMEQGKPQLALLMALLCGFMDLFDGIAARKFDCSSAFGEFFDAASDAICYGFMMAYLAWAGHLPWIPIVIIVGLGIVNSVARVLYAKRIGRATNYRSWAMERIVGYLAYLVGFGTAGISPVFYGWAGAGLMVFVLIHDLKRMLIDPVPA
jgi:phosphatidylglycerophosphate synthase